MEGGNIMSKYPKVSLKPYEFEEGFCEKCGYRVEHSWSKITCPECDKEIHYNEAEWVVIDVRDGVPSHRNEIE